ncbi:hypothetical protein SDC9_113643 [bioreactor metagenome]|uniref:Uncharacterized protein n=1 Tax=bioreactor metagenome TaxID=1076179 RepID=A0A645BNI4_9ZZZZ
MRHFRPARGALEKIHRLHDLPGNLPVLRKISPTGRLAPGTETGTHGGSDRQRVSGEDDLHVSTGQGRIVAAQPAEGSHQAVRERRHEARVIEELPDLVDLQLAGQPGLHQRRIKIVAILPTRRIRCIAAGQHRQNPLASALVRLLNGVGQIRGPVAIAHPDGQPVAAGSQLCAQRSGQRIVLGVDRAGAPEVVVVLSHQLQALGRDCASASHIPQERHDVVRDTRTPEGYEHDPVVKASSEHEPEPSVRIPMAVG